MKKRYKLIIFLGVVFVLATAYQWSINRHLKPIDNTARKLASGKFAALSSGKVHYNWYGAENGKITVLVHGFSTPSFVWQGVIEKLTNSGARVLTYDLFGRGWSDRPYALYNAEFYDQQLVELLENQNIVTPINLVGYSMGGAIATYFTAKHPDKLNRLALIAPAGISVNEGVLAQIIKLPIVGDWLMNVVGRDNLLKNMAEPSNQGKAIPNIVELYEQQMSYAGYLPALLSTLRHYPLGNLQAEYEKVGKSNLPVLAIWGTKDVVVPATNAISLKELIPTASIKLLEDGTHAITYSKPDEVSDALINFFSEQ